ncbi:EAL domain-containing protein [Amphritea sp. 1_MG-2023]|uniref:sensor domain-containing protein n=1 Tax=Amphritea sp. 1_MG-2023 TaxID=3062670 RepID=UPI0026E25C45|nr:bifunctional diguanylate cyclase/phosphodiesterase [Amphritea sp. 1_MG-2023]MDO6563784.1 EAL domain-containing protein [Amphritea sp. 1_MG-2023]
MRKEKVATARVIDDLKSSKKQLSDLHNKNTSMLEALPVAIVEMDFSLAKQHIDTVMQSYQGELSDWFHASPKNIDAIIEQISIKSVDGAACELFGADSPDKLISNFRQVFTPTALDLIKKNLVLYYNGQTSVKSETEFARFDGSTFAASTYTTLALNSEGSWSRMVVIVEDITEKVTATKAVNSFFDLDINLNIITDLDSIIVRANQGWQSLLGYSPVNLEGLWLLDLVHPSDTDATINAMLSARANNTTLSFENRCKDHHGEYHLLSWSASCPSESNLIYAVATDITQQRQAEEQLHTAASIINSTSEGTMTTDLDGCIQDVNPAFSAITGYQRADIVGKNPRVLSSGRHDRNFYQNMWKALVVDGQWQGEVWNRTRAGEVYPQFLTINKLTDHQERLQGYVGVFTDISDIKQSEETIIKLSTLDALTELPNWTVFTERLQHSIDRSARKNQQLCVLSVDIDNFKLINESLGFDIGDDLLIQASKRLKLCVRTEDTVARHGGDEFKLLIEDVQDTAVIHKVVEQLYAAFNDPFMQNGQLIYLSICIGISLYPADGDSISMLVRNADTALTQAKSLGSGRYQFYSQALTEVALESMLIENALRLAIKHEQLFLVYQPQFDIKTHQLVGLEALIRWQHPDIGLVSPMKFIPIAERTGMILEIGKWVIKTACMQGKAWLDAGYDFGRIAVNVSGSQLIHSDLYKDVKQILTLSQFDPERLEIEITESFIMQNEVKASEALNKLRKDGIRTAIDDFGTGYSSLSYLKKLPIDKLKIDKSFVNELPDNMDGVAIVNAIISLGKALNLSLIAEGVETLEQEQSLIHQGCDQVQGFLHSKPLASELVESRYLKG